ncbi:hypothetical protein CDAR_23811 [Caerostris darwini]|uniref:Uncharacterized protein n=1 Tax=Caerostris darwini TaxID=1538125 RepID=A0AAV4RAP3_9ARAC|nr:hypothetical protein CDAR_23811 [Caerostris darwini]
MLHIGALATTPSSPKFEHSAPYSPRITTSDEPGRANTPLDPSALQSTPCAHSRFNEWRSPVIHLYPAFGIFLYVPPEPGYPFHRFYFLYLRSLSSTHILLRRSPVIHLYPAFGIFLYVPPEPGYPFHRFTSCI